MHSIISVSLFRKLVCKAGESRKRKGEGDRIKLEAIALERVTNLKERLIPNLPVFALDSNSGIL